MSMLQSVASSSSERKFAAAFSTSKRFNTTRGGNVRLNYDHSGNVYVAPHQQYNTNDDDDDDDVNSYLGTTNNETVSLSCKMSIVMKRHWKLVCFSAALAAAIFIYLTFIRVPAPVAVKREKFVERTFADKPVKVSADGDKAQLVNVDVYMESRCSDTTSFIQNQLMPAWPKVKSFVNLQLFPYGKAKDSATGDDDFQFACQHGPVECQMNQMMCCAMKRVDFVADSYLPFIRCLQGEEPSMLRRCCQESNLLFEDIETCANGKEGRRIHHDMGNRTNSLSPKLYFVPWILINGRRDKEALNDFLPAVCKYAKSKPPGCTADH